jgi:hypothetical protein
MPGQWRDCPDRERGKVNEINLAIDDMENPCELAQILKVPINHLWARPMPDGTPAGKGRMLNTFYLPLNKKVARRIAAGKTAPPKTRKRQSSK